MATAPHEDEGNVPPSTVAPSRAPYALPLFVLIVMLILTLTAGVYRLSIGPGIDSPIQAVPTPVFLMLSVLVSLAVFVTLLRFVQSREHLVRTLMDYQVLLQRQRAELSNRNRSLSSTAQVQTNELGERLIELEQSRTAMVSLLEDLTESRDRIEAARAFDAAVLASLGEGVLVFDTQGRVTLMNAAAHSIAGLPGVPEDYIGRNGHELFSLIDPEGNPVPKDVGPFSRVVAAGAKSTRQIESNFRLKRSSGALIDIEYEVSPIIRGDVLSAIVVLVRDITEQRRIDRSKSEFVSLASHQLRTPLTAISWYAELLLSEAGPKLAPQEKEYLDEVYRANRRMIELVDALLNVSRIEMGTISIQPIAMDLPAFIRDIISIFGPIIATKHITVHSEFAPDVGVYPADQKVMDIVMQNLISNAIKYTPDNGTVTVRLLRDDANVVITVSDTGIGIPREAQGRVFGKLFRADNAQIAEADGSGLGLYLVKSILEQVGGGISFTSEIGAGSTFVVRLPAAGMKARAGVRAIASAPPSAGSDDMTVPAHTP